MKPEIKPWAIAGGAVIGLAAAAMIGGIIGVKGCSGCAPEAPIVIVPEGIDAGPGDREIDARLDGAVTRAREETERLEREHAAEMERWNDAQRQKFDALRDDPEAADEYIRNVNRMLRGGAS